MAPTPNGSIDAIGKWDISCRGRFKSLLVEKERYLLELCRYVVLNPVRAHMVEGTGKGVSFFCSSRTELLCVLFLPDDLGGHRFKH